MLSNAGANLEKRVKLLKNVNSFFPTSVVYILRFVPLASDKAAVLLLLAGSLSLLRVPQTLARASENSPSRFPAICPASQEGRN